MFVCRSLMKIQFNNYLIIKSTFGFSVEVLFFFFSFNGETTVK